MQKLLEDKPLMTIQYTQHFNPVKETVEKELKWSHPPNHLMNDL